MATDKSTRIQAVLIETFAELEDTFRRKREELETIPDDGEDPIEPPDPGPGPLSEADQRAVDRMRQGERIQLVPRRGNWRVDYRRPDGKAIVGIPQTTIVRALMDAESNTAGGFPKLPEGQADMSVEEQRAIAVDLKALGAKDSCSVRWEKNGTHADTNWAGHKAFPKRGLILEPVAWIKSKR